MLVILLVIALRRKDYLCPLGVLWGSTFSSPLSLDLFPVIDVITKNEVIDCLSQIILVKRVVQI